VTIKVINEECYRPQDISYYICPSETFMTLQQYEFPFPGGFDGQKYLTRPDVTSDQEWQNWVPTTSYYARRSSAPGFKLEVTERLRPSQPFYNGLYTTDSETPAALTNIGETVWLCSDIEYCPGFKEYSACETGQVDG
jgi:hypothetical protein